MIIDLQNISYCYQNRTKALKNINFSVTEGEKLVIAGSNGAGKSTLFLILNGILKPENGIYNFEGKHVKYTKNELYNLRKSIGIVFQEPDSQIFSSSVYEEISFGPLNLDLPHEIVRKRVSGALKILDIENLQDKPAHLLSYGQKKRVTIASILAMDPKIIIFDEPTSGLDPAHAAEIISLLDDLHKNGKTIIISTHDMNLAYQWASRIVVLNDGEICGDGKPIDIFNSSSIIRKNKLELPLVLQVFGSLKNQQLPYPANIMELVERLNIQL